VIHLERNMGKHSSQKMHSHFLAEEVLVALANVPDMMVSLHEPLPEPQFQKLSKQQFQKHVEWVAWMKWNYPEAFRYCDFGDIPVLRNLLRRVWTCRDLRCKEWFTFLLRKYHADVVKRGESREKDFRDWVGTKTLIDMVIPESIPATLAQLEANKADVPPRSYFEDCAFYLQRNLRRVCVCRNKECAVTPFFFKHKKNQKYCSTQCSLPKLLASKRNWWRDNRSKSKKGRK
jgi:hypothetical protein